MLKPAIKNMNCTHATVNTVPDFLSTKLRSRRVVLLGEWKVAMAYSLKFI
jgi:hypothetical protein